MKNKVVFWSLVFGVWIAALSISGYAQSTSQSFPTAVTTNEISGTIKARDIGDGRLTSYFYAFNAAQGDVFINVVTENFNGDIDVFTLEGLKTLTKIVVYADAPSNETGRVVYLRKPEKLLLRIEGRSPNDDAATFRIKFAGSFQAVAASEQTEEPKLPEVSARNDSPVVVNSVGTIIAVKPKPTPAPKEAIAENDSKKPKTGAVSEISVETDDGESVVAETAKTAESSEKGEVKEIAVETETETEIVADVQAKKPETADKLEVEITETPSETAAQTPPLAAESENAKSAPETKPAASAKKPKTKKPVAPNPLENVRLIVVLKDGTIIERPMSEVSRVNVDNKGMLTIVAKDGKIARYSILEVAKMTIE